MFCFSRASNNGSDGLKGSLLRKADEFPKLFERYGVPCIILRFMKAEF
jgi:hypothetical protein